MSDEFRITSEWQKPGPIRYTPTITRVENGRLEVRPVKRGEIMGGRFDGLAIPFSPDVEWSEDGETFMVKDEAGGSES